MTNSMLKRPMLCLVHMGDVQTMQSFAELDCRFAAIPISALSACEERLDEWLPDVVVLALNRRWSESPSCTDVLKRIRTYCDIRHIPVMAITEERLDQDINTALLPDAILHPSEHQELQLQIQKWIRRRERILEQILIDPLIHVWNSRYLQREVQMQLDAMKRSFDRLTLVYMEPDAWPDASPADSPTRHYKPLQALATFTQQAIRPTDRIARHADGGLVLVLPHTSKEEAAKLMNRLMRTYAEQTADAAEREQQQVTFSAKIREFLDPSVPAEHCLAQMPFTTKDPHERRSLVVIPDDAGATGIRKLNIAIIDDDRLIREMRQLADIGEDQYEIEIRAYPDGELFFEDPWHRRNEQYIVIIDRIMPKMEGLEVLRMLRSHYPRRSYLCVIVSSKGSDADITWSIQNGADDYIVKPFSLKELRARIRRLIEVPR